MTTTLPKYRLMANGGIAHIAEDGQPLCGVDVVAKQLGYVHPDTTDLYDICGKCYDRREVNEREDGDGD